MQKIRKGDEVVVLAGKDKGKTGTVLNVFKDDAKVIVVRYELVAVAITCGSPRLVFT